VAVSYHGMLPIVEAGDVIAFTAPLRPLADHYLAPDEYYAGDYYVRHAVSATVNVADGSLRIDAPAAGWQHTLTLWRQNLSHFIFYKTGLDADAADLLDAVLTGNDEMLSEQVRRDFVLSGTAHVLALSGAHVAVIALIVSLLFFPLRIAGYRRAGQVCVVLSIWFYVALVGFPASVVRTAVMATMLIGGQLLLRGSSSLNNLCFAALAILVVAPRSLFAPGFQLSFAAVASILMFGPLFPLRACRSKWLRWLRSWIAVSVCAMLGTCALSAYYFHQVPLLFLLSNLPMGLLLPLFMIFGVAAIIFAFAGCCCGPIVAVENWLYDVMQVVCGAVASVGGGTVGGVYPQWWMVAAFYLILVLAWMAIVRRKVVYGFACGMIAVTLSAVAFILRTPVQPYVGALYDYYGTTLLVADRQRAMLLTDVAAGHHASMRERFGFRMQHFMARRGIDSLEVLTSDMDMGWLKTDSASWQVGDLRVALLNRRVGAADAIPASWFGADWIVVSTGFRGDLVAVISAVQPRHVVLSRRLGQGRRKRLEAVLRDAGIGYSVGFEGDLSGDALRMESPSRK